jgi:hypothetical protein
VPTTCRRKIIVSHSSFRITSPGSLIGAIPAVLGFVPTKSIVLVTVEKGLLGAVMRADLSADLIDHAGRLADAAASTGADSVIIVVVDDDTALCPMCKDDHVRLCEAIGGALAGHQIGVSAAHVVDVIGVGGTWHRLDGDADSGPVEDPQSSALAAAAVLDGRRLYSSREDLKALIAVTDPARTAALAELVAARSEKRDTELRADANGRRCRDVADALAAAACITAGTGLDDTTIANLACAITDGAVRDMLYAQVVGVDSGALENLWAELSRTLPDPWRAESLALAAFSSYARGDGPLAGIALEAALAVNPAHRMARLLDAALQAGMHPTKIRELAVR